MNKISTLINEATPLLLLYYYLLHNIIKQRYINFILILWILKCVSNND